MSDTIDWKGLSGAHYRYWFLASFKPDAIQDIGGNYAFVKLLPNGNYFPLYFGQADSLRARLPNHEVWPEAVRLGATHVMAHTTPAGESARKIEERDLIQYWNPALNTQHRTTA